MRKKIVVVLLLCLTVALTAAGGAVAEEQESRQDVTVAILLPSAWVSAPMYCGGWMAKYKESGLAPIARAITGGVSAMILGDSFDKAAESRRSEQWVERTLSLQSMQVALRYEYAELVSGGGMKVAPFDAVDAATEAAMPAVWQEESRTPRALCDLCKKTGATYVIYADMLGYTKDCKTTALGFKENWYATTALRTEFYDQTGNLVFAHIASEKARDRDEKTAWLSCVQSAVRAWRNTPATEQLPRNPFPAQKASVTGHWIAEEFLDKSTAQVLLAPGSTVLVWAEFPSSPSSKTVAGFGKSIADQLVKRGFTATVKELPMPPAPDAPAPVTSTFDRSAEGLRKVARAANCQYAIYAQILSENMYYHGGWRKPVSFDSVLCVKVVDATTGEFRTNVWDEETKKLPNIVVAAACGK